MQAFIALLRLDASRLFTIGELLDQLNLLATNKWTRLIAEGIAALARDLAGKAMPVPDLVEWFAEWARDIRGEQRGLLLLTAHRAKGLEFDDVVILNCDWERLSKGEDVDAPRRLLYVAMTRARRSLALITQADHPYMNQSLTAILKRTVTPETHGLRGGMRHYQMPELKLVDLSWAGRLRDGHTSLAAITAAKVGDPVTLGRDRQRWVIRDENGRVLGCMSRAYGPPKGAAFIKGEIGAIVRWRKSDNEEEFRKHLHRDDWEVVLPELVFD